MKTAIVVALAAVALVGCTAKTEPQVKTVTVTESASPSAEPGASVDEILGETGSVTTINAGDARACELVRLAATREANSPSWIDIMSDAGYKARDYDLQDAIDKAYWTSSNSLATQRVRAIVRYCEELV